MSLHFTKIVFTNFKAFKKYTFNLHKFNVLVGPNNAGKSTIITSFRMLFIALKKARSRSPEQLSGPNGVSRGYNIDLSGMGVAEENLFHNYDDSVPATIVFTLSNMSTLTLYSPNPSVCHLFVGGAIKIPESPSEFRKLISITISFVPVLGPVDHIEPLYQKEAAQRALYNYTASRNFRNIWHHFPEKFAQFRNLLMETWPGMDINPPEIMYDLDKPTLSMFCPEKRMPREICWSGFGFQVWCQMLTHLVQSQESSIFLIDEPDIYLHSDLQRQLVGLLRDLGPDVIIATHSTEMIAEAEPDEVVIVNKDNKQSRRVKNPAQLLPLFHALGSNLNPVLTQLAKTKRVVFVEGQDFVILSKLARKLGFKKMAARSDFAVLPIGGFNPQKVKNMKEGIERALGHAVKAALVLDRDYRSSDEISEITKDCSKFCDVTRILEVKEIENILLVPEAIDRALEKKIQDKAKRTGCSSSYTSMADNVLNNYCDQEKDAVMSQYITNAARFAKQTKSREDTSVHNKIAIASFNEAWDQTNGPFGMVPGKAAISEINKVATETYHVSISASLIAESIKKTEIVASIRGLLVSINEMLQT